MHKTGTTLSTNLMYFMFIQGSTQKQTNKQNTHHLDLGRYRDSNSKMFPRPHHRMARFMGQGLGLCYSFTELRVWHSRRERFILRHWLVPCGGWHLRNLRGEPAGRRPGWGLEATSCFSGKPHAMLPRPPTHGARLALMLQVRLLYLKPADCSCQPHLQNTFMATPGPHNPARKPG